MKIYFSISDPTLHNIMLETRNPHFMDAPRFRDFVEAEYHVLFQVQLNRPLNVYNSLYKLYKVRTISSSKPSSTSSVQGASLTFPKHRVLSERTNGVGEDNRSCGRRKHILCQLFIIRPALCTLCAIMLWSMKCALCPVMATHFRMMLSMPSDKHRVIRRHV